MSNQNVRTSRINFRSKNVMIDTARYDISPPTAAIIQEAKLLGLLSNFGGSGTTGHQGFQGRQGNQGFALKDFGEFRKTSISDVIPRPNSM